ncbi:type III-B CRISPR module RAMP protein Cmr1 [Streptomyces thermovulgaris]|uniref:type III-B CRISPR module RAMP protein Cmr1 n=1 Tax=Streptomyces thermovulgaris TaxID=1934 RepID=UPI0013025C5E|nr:type III-B CRISPR module RAMP protein Cmr1 [Streptomyces thermovulgaris]
MPWTTLALQTTTPVFNGHDDEGAGIRVPSLRGGMRYWFRALAGTVVGDDLRLLAALEHEVFGGTGHQSPVVLRIPDPPRTADRAEARFLGVKGGEHIQYLLGQGLYERTPSKRPAHEGLTRSFVAAETDFHLDLRFTPGTSEAAASLALASLWLLCTYGGIGARVRKGFGGLRITGVSGGTLPGDWTPDDLLTPGLAYYEGLDRLTADHGALARHRTWLAALKAAPDDLATRPDPWRGTRPTYPVLGQHTAAALRPRPATWPTLLITAGKEWRHFRASEGPSETGGRIHTPEYRKVIRGNSDHFPLGALGLPITFYDGRNKDTVNVRNGAEHLRRASPVWLRTVGTDRTRRQLFSFAFLGAFLPQDDKELRVRLGERTLQVTDQDLHDRAMTWLDTMRKGGTFVRTDPE